MEQKEIFDNKNNGEGVKFYNTNLNLNAQKQDKSPTQSLKCDGINKCDQKMKSKSN